MNVVLTMVRRAGLPGLPSGTMDGFVAFNRFRRDWVVICICPEQLFLNGKRRR